MQIACLVDTKKNLRLAFKKTIARRDYQDILCTARTCCTDAQLTKIVTTDNFLSALSVNLHIDAWKCLPGSAGPDLTCYHFFEF